VQGRPDGFRGALILAAEDLGRLQLAVGQMNLAASDASVAVRLGALADGFRELRRPVAGAGKSAGLVLAYPGPDVQNSDVSALLAVGRSLSAALALALPALGKPAEAPSGARSCADQGLAGESTALRVFAPALDYLRPEPARQELTLPN
jgi:hypothetical protein